VTRGESDAAVPGAPGTARTVGSGTTTSAMAREARPARAANEDWMSER